MRPLCFGGSFNPIHHGHLICARAAAEAAGFHRVLLIPAAVPPHKPGATNLVAPEHRLAMCRLAAGLQPALFEVDDRELRRTGPSYTIDTVRELKSHGWPSVTWLIGADMIEQLPTWHDADRLIEETEFLVMARPGCPLDFAALPPAYRKLKKRIVPAPLLDISGTEIRHRIAMGRSIEFLVPPAVARYIAEHGLYASADPG